MDQAQLLDKLKEYGADTGGALDRFMGDAELYESCLLALFEDANLAYLSEAIASKEYEKAFRAAHALKGVTGNLGLTPLYKTICVLVESLRMDDYSNTEAEYDAVRRELARAAAIFSDGAAPAELAGTENAAPPPKAKNAKAELTQGHLIFIAASTLLLVIVIVSLLFSKLTNNYIENVSVESSNHLEEINYQIKLYIEGEIENDWQVAYSVRNSFIHSVKNNDKADIFKFLSVERDTWLVNNIIVYTEDGAGMGTDGSIIANDVASSTMYNANRLGEYMSIIQSTIIYTLPIQSDLMINGEKIAAISVVRDLQSFLDNMDFSSFGGSAHIYLTESRGRIVSRLTTEGAAETFNIASEFVDGELSCLSDPSLTSEDMFSASKPLTFLLSRADGRDYVVSTPINTRQSEMNLIYMVPDMVVNQTINRFSEDITLLSIGILLVLTVVILSVFLVLYRSRKKQFDMAIISRERTFDLLVANTNTAFALLSTKQEEPTYISANAADIINAPFRSLLRTEDGFHIVGEGESETESLREVNHELAEWDGKTMFDSGYIPRPGGGDSGYYEVQLYPVTGDDDEYVAIIQDVTQQFNREDAVKNALEMAERSNAAKSRFLSNMSHDIRTPMNAIVNMTKFAKESKNDPARLDEYLDAIGESSDHLLQLINDVLDMSRIESGQAVIESAPFSITAELSRIADIVRPLCQARKQSFTTDFGGLRAESVLGDRVKVAQILLNLLGNAVKFTPEGGAISFAATETPSLRAGIAAIRFIVRDNGIGIPEENLAGIFGAFVRVDDKRVSKIEGTGLGLSICQSYVNAMGGKISCESEAGRGSAFTVELFFEETAARPAEHAAPVQFGKTPFPGKRCLLCEDNDINQVIARKLLTQIGFAVDIASDGQEGVRRFTLSEKGYYSVIYMDIQMPFMDGYEATAAIRASAHPDAKTIPIIAMTANVFAEDVEKARISGMNAHLGKPVDISELMLETDKLLNKEIWEN